jgi:hypothetical protein
MPDDLRALTDEQLAERLESIKGVAHWRPHVLAEAARRLRQRQQTTHARARAELDRLAAEEQEG